MNSRVPFLLGSSRRKQCVICFKYVGCFRMRTNTMRKFSAELMKSICFFTASYRSKSTKMYASAILGIQIDHVKHIRIWASDSFHRGGNRIRRHKDLVAVFRWRKSYDRRIVPICIKYNSYVVFSFYRWGRWILDWTYPRERERKRQTLDNGSNENVNIK